jgi:hypothetical protein
MALPGPFFTTMAERNFTIEGREMPGLFAGR